MLKDLKCFGKSEGYFKIKRIGDFADSQDQGFNLIDTQAIDFDETKKKKLCEELKQDHCKSCGALDIIDEQKTINFIEFKRFSHPPDLEDQKAMSELPEKIKDGREILLNIIRGKI